MSPRMKWRPGSPSCATRASIPGSATRGPAAARPSIGHQAAAQDGRSLSPLRPRNGRSAGAGRAARPGTAGRALIGDQLRVPIVWCELAPCISHHTNPAALGEADNRARALSAGWRLDRLGRLTCPKCQQSSPWFWPAHPVVPWDKEAAATMAALMAARDRMNGASRDAEVAHEAWVAPTLSAESARPSLWTVGRHRR